MKRAIGFLLIFLVFGAILLCINNTENDMLLTEEENISLDEISSANNFIRIRSKEDSESLSFSIKSKEKCGIVFYMPIYHFGELKINGQLVISEASPYKLFKIRGNEFIKTDDGYMMFAKVTSVNRRGKIYVGTESGYYMYLVMTGFIRFFLIGFFFSVLIISILLYMNARDETYLKILFFTAFISLLMSLFGHNMAFHYIFNTSNLFANLSIHQILYFISVPIVIISLFKIYRERFSLWILLANMSVLFLILIMGLFFSEIKLFFIIIFGLVLFFTIVYILFMAVRDNLRFSSLMFFGGSIYAFTLFISILEELDIIKWGLLFKFEFPLLFGMAFYVLMFLLASINSFSSSYRRLNIISNDLEEIVKDRTSTLYNELEKTKKQLTFDDLTGLLSRKRGMERLIKVHKNHSKGYIIYVDVDGLKQTNDLHGHSAGDVYLKNVANTLRIYLRESDFAFRTGGDEFIVFIEANKEKTKAIMEQISKRIKNTSYLDSHYVDISYGIASILEGNGSIDEVIDKADKRMFEMKNKHKRLK